MMYADPGVALVANHAIAPREQQRRALNRNGHYRVDASVEPRAQFEAGVDDGVKHDAGRIRLVGVLGYLPALAELAEHPSEIRLVSHGPRPAERPLDRARCSGISLLCN